MVTLRVTRRAAAVLILTLLIPTASFAQKHPIAHEDVWLARRLSGPAISPDGRYDAFPIRDWDRWLDDRRPSLFVQAAERGAPATDLRTSTARARWPAARATAGICPTGSR